MKKSYQLCLAVAVLCLHSLNFSMLRIGYYNRQNILRRVRAEGAIARRRQAQFARFQNSQIAPQEKEEKQAPPPSEKQSDTQESFYAAAAA